MRKLLSKNGWALLLILALILAACTPATPAVQEPAQEESQAEEPAEAAPEASTLRVGIYAYMTNGIPFDEEVAACEASHPDLNIEVLPIPGEESAWQAITQKMQLEAQDQEASWDLIYGPTPFVEPGAMAALDLLEPLDSHFSDEYWNDIYTGVRNEIKYSGDGMTYHIPLWTDVFGLIYRPSMLEEAVGTSDPPSNWDEILDYCAQIQDHYGDELSCFGADWSFSHRMFIPIMGTFTQNIFTDEGVINLDDPAALKTLELMQELYQYLPANAAEPLGSSQTFQAGGVAMEIYWQAQYLRALQAGVPEDDMEIAPFPEGDFENTLFWSGGIIIPKYTNNLDGALTFIKDCVLGEESIRDIYNNYKIVPLKSAVQMLEDSGDMPNWAPPLIGLLDVGQSIPSNRYFLTVEQPAFQEEVEKMLLAGQSPQDTLDALKTRFEEGLAEVQ
jgi:ABC-type glycerol-3-phosphate transport system substrate-binding protein